MPSCQSAEVAQPTQARDREDATFPEVLATLLYMAKLGHDGCYSLRTRKTHLSELFKPGSNFAPAVCRAQLQVDFLLLMSFVDNLGGLHFD